MQFQCVAHHRITSYNVCYTKLLRRRKNEGDLFPKKKTLVAKPTSARLEAILAEDAASKQELKELQALADREDPSRIEAVRNEQFATRTANKIAELQGKIARGDFAPAPKKKPLKLTGENLKKELELADIKEAFLIGKFNDTKRNRRAFEKALDILPGASGLVRSFFTSFDVSALGRLA